MDDLERLQKDGKLARLQRSNAHTPTQRFPGTIAMEIGTAITSGHYRPGDIEQRYRVQRTVQYFAHYLSRSDQDSLCKGVDYAQDEGRNQSEPEGELDSTGSERVVPDLRRGTRSGPPPQPLRAAQRY